MDSHGLEASPRCAGRDVVRGRCVVADSRDRPLLCSASGRLTLVGADNVRPP
jgi:hypothetical protein